MVTNLHSTTRLNEIARLQLNNPKHDAILNSLAEQTAKELDIEICLISIVLDEAQVFAGSHGLSGWLKEANGTPIEWSFCVNSIDKGEPFTVNNAAENELVRENPLVTIDGIHCYAGVPLITKNNEVIGNYCVLGKNVRNFGEDELEILRGYADRVVERIELMAE